MPTATPDDVRGVIDTSLDDPAIESKLDDAQYRNEKYNDVTDQTTEDTTQIEKYLAALLIVESKDPRHESTSGASRSVTYESGRKQDLEARVSQLDPSGQLVPAAIQNTDRYVGSTADE